MDLHLVFALNWLRIARSAGARVFFGANHQREAKL